MLTKKEIESKGFSVSFTNGTGSGGQKRNRTYSVAIVKHIESGAIQRCDDGRSANANMNTAYEKLVFDLEAEITQKNAEEFNEARKKAIEKGTIRTYDFKRGVVKNHLTGKEANLRKVLDGKVELIN